MRFTFTFHFSTVFQCWIIFIIPLMLEICVFTVVSYVLSQLYSCTLCAGQLIVASLLNRNIKCRLFVRDPEKATALFGMQDEGKLKVWFQFLSASPCWQWQIIFCFSSHYIFIMWKKIYIFVDTSSPSGYTFL